MAMAFSSLLWGGFLRGCRRRQEGILVVEQTILEELRRYDKIWESHARMIKLAESAHRITQDLHEMSFLSLLGSQQTP